MTAQKFNPPNKLVIFGGASISSADDATGTTYWCMCARYEKWTPQRVRVFRQLGNEQAIEIAFDPQLPGRGIINDAGYIHGTTEGDDITREAWRVLVPGFVQKAQAVAVIEEATQLHEPDYVHDELIDELTSAPGLHVRFNKLKRAVLQLREIAKRRGELH